MRSELEKELRVFLRCRTVVDSSSPCIAPAPGTACRSALLDLSELFEPILACQLRESMLEGERFDLEPVYRVLSTEARTQFDKMVQECSDRLRGEFRELVSNLLPLL